MLLKTAYVSVLQLKPPPPPLHLPFFHLSHCTSLPAPHWQFSMIFCVLSPCQHFGNVNTLSGCQSVPRHLSDKPYVLILAHKTQRCSKAVENIKKVCITSTSSLPAFRYSMFIHYNISAEAANSMHTGAKLKGSQRMHAQWLRCTCWVRVTCLTHVRKPEMFKVCSKIPSVA